MTGSDSKASPNLPWVEKYRPNQLDELISHKDIISTIDKFIDQNRLPHLLFYGPPGTGKTSTILAVAKQIYSPKEFNSMVLEMNASDDRGIGMVRNNVLSFASTRTIFKSGFKIVILDEADAMTRDAQNSLRRVIEKFTENTRFCIICNYLSKIIPALQSRCTRFRFGPLTPDQMVPRLEHVIDKESINMKEDGMKAVVTLANGDMRRALNILQSTHMAYNLVNEDNVYTCVGHPLKQDIENVVQWSLNEGFTTAYNNISQLKTAKGLALQDILTEIHTYVHKIEMPVEVKIHLLEKMAEVDLFHGLTVADYEQSAISGTFPSNFLSPSPPVTTNIVVSWARYRLASGTSEKIQLSSFLAAFQLARDMIVDAAE